MVTPNKRIKQLAAQAVYYDEDEETWEFDRNKFAELIVKECIMLLYEDDGATHHEELILEHFGIEE